MPVLVVAGRAKPIPNGRPQSTGAKRIYRFAALASIDNVASNFVSRF